MISSSLDRKLIKKFFINVRVKILNRPLKTKNNLDINNIFAKDGSIKSEIRIEIISRINFCRQAIKEAIPNLVKLPEGMEMTEERLEILTDNYPQYYLNMFEKTRKGN